MELKKIKAEDLVFSGEIEDDRTNTYLQLNDYDWMDYVLSTRFRTKDEVLQVKFEHSGLIVSRMIVDYSSKDSSGQVIFEYSTSIFAKHIKKFLQRHIASWDDKCTFDGEDIVIDFFNEVLDKGKRTYT